MASEVAQLAGIARRQHGLWTRVQSSAVGVGRAQTARLLRDGDWLELRPDVFCAASRPADEIGAILAVCLEIGAPAAAAGAAAAFVRRYPGIVAPALMTVHVPLNRRIAVEGCNVERSRRFPAVVAHADGVPVLPRSDTLLTLAAEVAHPVLLDCLQELVREGKVRPDELWPVLTRGRSGSAALRRALEELSEGGDSRPERRLRRALRRAGVAGFEFGWELVLRDGTRYWPDLWNDASEVCLEVDGLATHTKASRMEGDRVRDNRLSLAGIAVARFTAGRVNRAIDAVVAEVAAAVAVRSRRAAGTRPYLARRRTGSAA